MANSKKTYKIAGMERVDTITEKISLQESLVVLFNAMIKNEGCVQSFDINRFKDKVSILAIGKGVSNIFDVDFMTTLNENKVLQALISISKIVKLKACKDGVEKLKEVNFEKVNTGKIEVFPIVSKEIKNKKERMEFTIEIKDLATNGKGLLDDIKVENIIQHFKYIYRETINDGTKINIITNKRLEGKNIDGTLVNKGSYVIDDNAQILLYYMKSEKGGFEVLINNVKVESYTINHLINWRREPLRRAGYTFSRLFISLRLTMPEFDLNNVDFIDELVELYDDKILKAIREHGEEFTNPIVNISLVYDRNKMNKIKVSLNEEYTAGVVNKLLDTYYSNNIER